MDKYKRTSEENIEKFTAIFERTIDLIYTKILNSNPIPKLSKATTEALFVGVANNIDALEEQTHEILNEKYLNLRHNDLFSVHRI